MNTKSKNLLLATNFLNKQTNEFKLSSSFTFFVSALMSFHIASANTHPELRPGSNNGPQVGQDTHGNPGGNGVYQPVPVSDTPSTGSSGGHYGSGEVHIPAGATGAFNIAARSKNNSRPAKPGQSLPNPDGQDNGNGVYQPGDGAGDYGHSGGFDDAGGVRGSGGFDSTGGKSRSGGGTYGPMLNVQANTQANAQDKKSQTNSKTSSVLLSLEEQMQIMNLRSLMLNEGATLVEIQKINQSSASLKADIFMYLKDIQLEQTQSYWQVLADDMQALQQQYSKIQIQHGAMAAVAASSLLALKYLGKRSMITAVVFSGSVMAAEIYDYQAQPELLLVDSSLSDQQVSKILNSKTYTASLKSLLKDLSSYGVKL